ncbi:ATP12, ATPase F1F0-assembly protein [Niveomyces insectorum RCEF 264]|uniref:ATP12, ATPase F1F0-assembly protein n=1 Tax=Niveomyces insectorum RCEF 264 TaxID=1081102 RepID=A0A167UJ39_9HYPO|nr:ATP12, ATPase F1F0-assembly protein [Niveomyces insectorum RCEF 264]
MRSIARIRLPSGTPTSAPTTAAPVAAANTPSRQPAPPVSCARSLCTSSAVAARVAPAFDVAGGLAAAAAASPPGPPPAPSAATDDQRAAEARTLRLAARQKIQAAKANAAHDGKSDSTSDSKNKTRPAGGRFWTHTTVAPTEDGEALQVLLDRRPLRHPTTKAVVRLPPHKRLLAHALAVEWDQMTSVRQATQGHRVPLTSLVCRALDLAPPPDKGTTTTTTRTSAIHDLLRYLDTDSLLCWEPPEDSDHSGSSSNARVMRPGQPPVTLRQLQEQTAVPIVAHVARHVWPGVTLAPVLGADHALRPRAHPAATRAAAEAWLTGLDGWDLAGVERATLAGKSLVVATRLVAAWSGAMRSSNNNTAAADSDGELASFAAEDAATATSLETAFQTAQWGEVEDTHDVDHADLRRHFGSVVLLVA